MKAIDKFRNSLSKLREREIDHVMMPPSSIERNLDEIERELEERFIELPVDADNVPIKVNDEMESVHRPKEVFIVKRLKYSEKHGWMIGGAARDDLSEYGLYAPFNCHHYKPPTVEDVLREFALACEDAGNAGPEVKRIAEKFAERLQLRGEDDG